MEEQKEGKKLLLAVALDESNNYYSVELAQGSNVAETAFSAAVIARCLVRDGILEDVKDFTDLIIKYANDDLYKEVQNENEEKQLS